MSIYIAIPTMYDNQVEFTVNEAIRFADKPEKLTIGLSLMETAHSELDYEVFYEKKIAPLLNYPQVKFKRFKVGEYLPSIGFGRDSSLSMYTDEDYILQIDSHTLFEKGWDTKLIDIYEGALKETNNPKTIVTSYLPMYVHLDNDQRVSEDKDKLASYPIMMFRTWYDTGIPAWKDHNLRTKGIVRDELYLPCIKFNAQFAFSNKNYIENTGLGIDTIFWEEEIVQTMNLLSAGFSLVFPNMVVPLSHLFQNNTSPDVNHPAYRVTGANPRLIPNEEYIGGIKESWLRFIKDPANAEKVKKFTEYTKVNIKYGPFQEGYIPTDYNR